MEKKEHEPRTEEPRSLWDRLESSLQRQEVFTIRRIIGEEILDRNEALWTEVDALEDILREAQDQNDDLSQKLAARQTLPASLERTLLEAHLKLLLHKLGVVEEAERRTKEGHNLDGNEGETGMHLASDSNGNGSKPPAFAKNRRSSSADGTTKSLKQDARRSTSSFLASTGAPLRSEVVYRAARELCISRDSTSNGPESERSNAAREVTEDGHHRWGGACNTKQNRSGCGDSRPSTAAASRPVSSRSARSAPGCLGLSPPAVDIDTIDGALDDLRAAFAQEAEYLFEQVAELTAMLEDEASRKIDAERRCKDNSAGDIVGTSSDLHSRVKKLEEAVRLQERTAVRTEHPRLLPLEGPQGRRGFTSDRGVRKRGGNGGNGVEVRPNSSSTPLPVRHASGEIDLTGGVRGSRASGPSAQDGFRPVLHPGGATNGNDTPLPIAESSCRHHLLPPRRKGCDQYGPGIATGIEDGLGPTPSRNTTPKDHENRSKGSKLGPPVSSKGRAEDNVCANRRTDARDEGESSRADDPSRRAHQRDLPSTLPSKLRSIVRTAQG